MIVSTETARMAKSRPRKNQSERSDLPCHIIMYLIFSRCYILYLTPKARKRDFNGVLVQGKIYFIDSYCKKTRLAPSRKKCYKLFS